MNLSIRTKLFLTLLAASTLAVVGMQAFMHWSFHNGLMELAEARQQERVDAIAERLVERYLEDGGWERLAGDKRLWVEILLGGWGGRDALGPEGPHPPRGPGRGMGYRMRLATGEPGVWPPTGFLDRARGPDGHPPRLEMRLMLLDGAGNLLYGRPELLKGTLRFPLRADGGRIGELALIPGPFIPETGELQFRDLAVIALGMILLSAAFAFPLSKRLSRPVLSFRDTAASRRGRLRSPGPHGRRRRAWPPRAGHQHPGGDPRAQRARPPPLGGRHLPRAAHPPGHPARGDRGLAGRGAPP